MGVYLHRDPIDFRAFVDAEATVPKASGSPAHLATPFIAAIGELYTVEATWRGADPARHTVEKRLRLRQAHSVPVLVHIQVPLLANLHAAMPGSLPGRAVHCRRHKP